MARRPEIGNVKLYPNRTLTKHDRLGYVLKFYCPIKQTRVRRACGTRDRREAGRVLRECQDRLRNGMYLDSNGAITLAQEQASTRSRIHEVLVPHSSNARSWDECFDHYYRFRKERGREKSLSDLSSRIDMVRRILVARRQRFGLPDGGPIQEFVTLENLEYLQERLLAGDEGRYDSRAPMSVNTTLSAMMAFVRFCKRHKWIDEVPAVAKLSVDEVMKGRPISESEFQSMLEAVPKVVGQRVTPSWKFVLNILWESAFRVADLMNFSWDDPKKTHPVFPTDQRFPTIVVSSQQKNKKSQEIPMLPGLQQLLQSVPLAHRRGWVANPMLLVGPEKVGDLIKPLRDDLKQLITSYNNSAIGRAFGVSEAAVRKWIASLKLDGTEVSPPRDAAPTMEVVAAIQARTLAAFAQPSFPFETRLTKEHVGRVVSEIGEKAHIIVQHEEHSAGKRVKYASAHDLRRSCAHRLINSGVSAETLRLLLRHEDFKTTERFYGAIRAAQSAANELNQKLTSPPQQTRSGDQKLSQLTEEQLRKLQAFLNAI